MVMDQDTGGRFRRMQGTSYYFITGLTHFNSTLPVILVCDTSPKGIGAVLSHRLVNGDERPIAFASRSLSAAEQNYSQLDEEALTVV